MFKTVLNNNKIVTFNKIKWKRSKTNDSFLKYISLIPKFVIFKLS